MDVSSVLHSSDGMIDVCRARSSAGGRYVAVGRSASRQEREEEICAVAHMHHVCRELQ